MTSIFTRIIQGELPCHRIAEDDNFLAFLDIRPVAPGHTLVIPKQAPDRFFDLDSDTLSHYLPFAKPIAHAIEAVVPCNRVGLMVAGLDVPHAHLHLVPMQSIADLRFDHATPANDDDLLAMATRIRQRLSV